jgi:hypothetical protein
MRRRLRYRWRLFDFGRRGVRGGLVSFGGIHFSYAGFWLEEILRCREACVWRQ